MRRALRGAARRDAGFTLIEVLAALVVFGFLIAGLAEGVRFGLSAYRLQADTIARNDDLDGTDRLLTALIGAIDPSASTDEPSVVGSRSALAFTTTIPVRIGDPATDRADASLTVRDGALLLSLLPHYHAAPLGSADVGRPQVTTLATGLDHVAFAYWDPGAQSWAATWRSSTPPALVRVTFAFRDPRRHWPPLVVRPLLSTYQG